MGSLGNNNFITNKNYEFGYMFWFIMVNRKMLWAFYVNITNNISYHISTSVLSKNQYKIIFWDRQIQITNLFLGFL